MTNTSSDRLKDRVAPRFRKVLNDLPERWREPAESLARTSWTALQDSRPRIADSARRISKVTSAIGADSTTLQSLTIATRAQPEAVANWFRLARFHLDHGNQDRAVAALEKAIEFSPKHFAAYTSKSAVEENFDPTQAITTLRRAVLSCAKPAERRTALSMLQGWDVEVPEALDRFYIQKVNDTGEGDRVTTPDIVAALDGLAFEILDDGIGRATQSAVDHLVSSTASSELTTRLSPTDVASFRYATVRKLIEKIHSDGHIKESLRYAEAMQPRHSSGWLTGFISRRQNEVAVLKAGGMELAAPQVRKVEPGGETTALYFLHNSLPKKSGGYATRTQGLLAGLKQGGHNVVGITRPGFPSVKGVFDQQPDVKETDKVRGVTYHRLVSSKQVMPRHDIDAFAEHYADLAEKYVDMYQPSVIHAASNWWNGFGALACARRHDLPMVYEVRGLWELTRASREPDWGNSEAYQLDAAYEASVAKGADRVITLSGALRNELIARGVNGDKISLVPNAVNLTHFNPRRPDHALIKKYGLTDKVVFGFAGTLTFYEGLDLLLEATAGLPADIRSKVVLLIVGDGPVLDDLKALAQSLGITENVRFVGRVPHQEVVNYLSVMDVTPFPRLPLPVCEAVPPIKPLESMAMGRAVLVSNVFVLQEMIEHGQTGIIVEAGSVDSLRDAMADLIASPELVARLGANARTWAEQHRGWDAVSRTLAEVYQELM